MTTSPTYSRPERLLQIASWGIAVTFALFLDMLGSLVMRDMAFAPRGGPPTLARYADTQADAALRATQRELQREQGALTDKADAFSIARNRAQQEYDQAKESLRNWIATRSATGDASRNPDVLARTRRLDELQQAVAGWQRQQDQIADQLDALRKRQDDVGARLAQSRAQAEWRYEQASRRYELVVFAWRLAFALPILVFAVWLFIRYRKVRYWPFVYGFGMFALTAFFVELVPYLPSFGGYVRVIVGIVLTVFAGVYMLRAFQRYVERKREEMRRSRRERAQAIGYEKAIAAYQKKLCPSCDKPWNLGGDGATFCIHCGLKLFDQCGGCGTRNFAFFPFCSGCGMPVSRAEGERRHAGGA
ncbi:double zinc ribbon family protein [Burkholderia pseudomallei MSHR7527]|uniref:double zinc ribbon family protein n=1 Tax=Burkholderia pseudomallei TaxID=28450 RepID=UPI0005315D08|nr:double zinc ribbon family protein [Burkholderia pseudomallei]KGS66373.1 double zinc ribbon family protein [Burkholderia pseudomallei MSHR7527]